MIFMLYLVAMEKGIEKVKISKIDSLEGGAQYSCIA